MYSEVTISHADRRPMYMQIMEQIRQRIAVGDWVPGQEIPSIRALAVAARVSVITVKRAYLELERAGVIVTRQGKGSYVAENADLSLRLRYEELDEHLGAAADLGRQLGMTAEELVERLREAAERAGRGGPGDRSESGDRSGPDDSSKPGDSSTAADSSEPDDTSKPADFSGPAHSSKPADIVKLSDPGEPPQPPDETSR